jgi:hypothetical protein
MSVQFGAAPQRSGTWSWFKPLIAQKSLMPQYEEDDTAYLVYGYDLPEVCFCTIYKGAVPDGVRQSYSQAQNDADKADFEANYKPYANRSIDDIPSRIIANTVKTGGGSSSNLGVNGAVTPVVFEYQPPNNYDIEISQLSFLFEDTTAFVFGNRFVYTGITTLANGLLLECKATDIAVTWQNMRRTRDVIEISKDFNIVTGTTNFMRVNVLLPRSLRLARAGTYAQPDYLRVTVRDDLSSVDFAECFFQGVKI